MVSKMELDCEEKGPELPVVSRRIYTAWVGLLHRLSPAGSLQNLLVSLLAEGGPCPRDHLAPFLSRTLLLLLIIGHTAAILQRWYHFHSWACLWGTQAMTTPPSSPQEGAKPPNAKVTSCCRFSNRGRGCQRPQ